LYYNKEGDDFTRYFIYEGDLLEIFRDLPISFLLMNILKRLLMLFCLSLISSISKCLKKKCHMACPVCRIHAFVVENKLKVASIMLNQDAKSRYIHFKSLSWSCQQGSAIYAGFLSWSDTFIIEQDQEEI
jgi:hypothetical protein